MGRVKTIDMRAYCTQKTKTKAMCSHKIKTQAHGQQTNHQPCAKQDTNTQLMRILISYVFTQDMTIWKHAVNEKHKLRATPQNTRGQKSAWPSKLETAHLHNETEREARVSESRHETKTQDMSAGIRTPHSIMKQSTQTRECMARARSKPHAHVKTRNDGSVRALSQNPWMTPDRSDRTLTHT